MSESSSGKQRRLLVVPRDVSGLYPLPQRERTRRFALDAGRDDATPPSTARPRSAGSRRERTLLFVAPLAEHSVAQGADGALQQIEDADIVDDDPTPRVEDMLRTNTRLPSGEGTFVLPRARHRRARLEALAHDPAPQRRARPARMRHAAAGVRRWHVALLVGAALVLLAALLMPVGAPVDVGAAERTQRVRAHLELMELLDRDALAAAVTPSPLDAALARTSDDDQHPLDDVESRVSTREERRKNRTSRAPAAPVPAPAPAPASAPAPGPAVAPGVAQADPVDGARVAPVARSAVAQRTDGFARVRTGAGFGGSR